MKITNPKIVVFYEQIITILKPVLEGKNVYTLKIFRSPSLIFTIYKIFFLFEKDFLLTLKQVCTMCTAKQIMAPIMSESRNGTRNRELDVSGT